MIHKAEMKLSEAGALLENGSRAFGEVYLQFKYSHDNKLEDYLDYIGHEPLGWLQGLPSKFNTAASFAKPKAAIIKLLKHPEVIAAVPPHILTLAHDALWTTYKKHATDIIARRSRGSEVIEHVEEPEVAEIEHLDTESVHSGNGPALVIGETLEDAPAANGRSWEQKYRILESAFRAVVGGQPATLILLDALTMS